MFVDTSALYALLVRTEERHEDVAAAYRNLLDAGRSLVTTSYVLVETCALLQHRFGLPSVRDLHARILPLLRIVWIGDELHRRAIDRLFRTNRRHLSLVDCSSLAVMESEGIREAFALDRDFEDQGFTLIPSS